MHTQNVLLLLDLFEVLNQGFDFGAEGYVVS